MICAVWSVYSANIVLSWAKWRFVSLAALSVPHGPGRPVIQRRRGHALHPASQVQGGAQLQGPLRLWPDQGGAGPERGAHGETTLLFVAPGLNTTGNVSELFSVSPPPLPSFFFSLFIHEPAGVCWPEVWWCMSSSFLFPLHFSPCSPPLLLFFSSSSSRVLSGPWSSLTAGGCLPRRARTTWSVSGCWRRPLTTSITCD